MRWFRSDLELGAVMGIVAGTIFALRWVFVAAVLIAAAGVLV